MIIYYYGVTTRVVAMREWIRARLGRREEGEPDGEDVGAAGEEAAVLSRFIGGDGMPSYTRKTDGSFVGDQESVFGPRFEAIMDEVEEVAGRADRYDTFTASVKASGDSRYAAEEKDVGGVPRVTLRDDVGAADVADVLGEFFDPSTYDGTVRYLEAEKTVEEEDGVVEGRITVDMGPIGSLERRKVVPTDDPADYMGRKEEWHPCERPERLPLYSSSMRNVEYGDPEMTLTLEYSMEM